MRIILDARKWSDGGIGLAVRLLAEQFTRKGVEVICISHENDVTKIEQTTEVKPVVCNARNYSLQELWQVGAAANTMQADLFYAPHYVVPFGLKIPIVTLIHDAIQLMFPDQFSLVQRTYAQYMIGRAMRISTKIVTQSETVRLDLLERFPGVMPAKVRTVRMIPDPIWRKVPGEPPPVWTPEVYCIYCGAYRQHKNLSFLAELWKSSRALPPLVIVGDDLDKYPALRKEIRPLLTTGQWVDGGLVPFSQLRELVAGAFALLLPSRYEGYGQPPLEAMLSGVPAIVSNCGAIPEISGSGAKVLPLTSPTLWIAELMELKKTEYRNQRIAIGSNWVASFDTDQWIEGHIAACREAIQLCPAKTP
ncbi:MAG: glycosyltransferase [bacterium]|nr:glycosyltransferase [bacterium]